MRTDGMLGHYEVVSQSQISQIPGLVLGGTSNLPAQRMISEQQRSELIVISIKEQPDVFYSENTRALYWVTNFTQPGYFVAQQIMLVGDDLVPMEGRLDLDAVGAP